MAAYLRTVVVMEGLGCGLVPNVFLSAGKMGFGLMNLTDSMVLKTDVKISSFCRFIYILHAYTL